MSPCDALPYWQAVQCRWRQAAPWARAFQWWVLGWMCGLTFAGLLVWSVT